jgi:hypothetical protein
VGDDSFVVTEVVVQFHVEMILIQMNVLMFLKFGRGLMDQDLKLHFFSQLALIITTLYRPFEELLHFTVFLMYAQNYTQHFHCFKISHWKETTFPHTLIIFKLERADLALNTVTLDTS